MSPLMDLRIDAAISGKEAEFAEAMEAREQRRAGFGDRGMAPTLHEVMLDRGGDMYDRLMTEHGFSEEDFRYAAKRLEASGDPDLETLAQHMRAMELYAAEEAERELTSMNAMESFLRERGIPMLEQRTPVDRPAAPDQHPRQRGWMPYPTGVRPVAEPDVDPDRAARGARSASFSQRLRSLAQEVAGMAKLSSNPRQRNRLLQRAEELQRMSLRQYQREMENDVASSDDPTEPNNVMSKLASDMDDKARAAGAQPDDSFNSFDDWDEENRAGSEDRTVDDVDAQKRAAADDMALDEDIPSMPRVPVPGRRVDEDENPGYGDEPLGLRRNRADDDVLQRVRKGTARFGAGQPRVGDRYGGQRRRYSAESIRESGGDMTLDELVAEDQRINWYGSHGSW